MNEHEDITPLTLHRRDYILRMLARRLQGGNWIRISNNELLDFGGEKFFQGCKVEYMNDGGWFTKKVKSGWDQDENVSVHLPWKITTPSGGGWTPPYPTPRIKSITNEGKTPMEHHVDRQKLKEAVTNNQVAYEELRTRAQDLYRAEIEKKTEEHVQGKIAFNEIQVRDKTGQILLPPDQSLDFDRQHQVIEMDVRDVMILSDEEFDSYVEASWSNLEALATVLKRLEEL